MVITEIQEEYRTGSACGYCFVQPWNSEIVKLLKRVQCISAFTLAILMGAMQAAGEAYALSSDAIVQAEDHLERAALDAPQRNNQDTIQRDVHDIMFLLSQSWNAAQKSDDVARKEYAHKALALLERSAARGHFDLAKAEPVRTLIQSLLSVKG